MATYKKQLLDKDGNVIYPDVGLDLDSVVYSDDPGETVDDIIDPNSYSTEEKWTGGYWVDGRKIYKKTINFGSLPNNNTKRVDLSISNLKKIVKIDQHVTNGSDDSALVLMSSTVANTGFNLYILNQQICIGTNADRSSISAYFTVYYTKTTD